MAQAPAPDQFVLTVTRERMGDPSIPVFHVELDDGRQSWPETFGSREQLQAYLTGLKSVLRMIGYATFLDWTTPDHHQEPAGVRWTIPRVGLAKMEELDAEGNTIEI